MSAIDSPGFEGAVGELPDLRPSDAINLAEDREDCPACDPATRGPEECRLCHDKGTVTRHTGRDHLSHSALSTLVNCDQRYAFAYEARLEPAERRVPLVLGAAYQKAIELGDPEAGVEHLRRAEKGIGQEAIDRAQVEETIVRAASKLYLELWGQVERSEYEYRVQLRSPWSGAYSRTFDLLGYADGLVDKGGWWELVENKLVGQIQAASVRKLPLDRQLLLARYGIWRATGKPVREVRYRWVRKPSIKQRAGRKKDKSDAETVEQFCERIAADYADRGREFYAHEEYLMPSTDDLVRVEAELWSWAERLRRARRDRIWTRNTSWCHEYGGCAFLSLCLGDPDAHGLYRTRPERPVAADFLND